MDTLEPVPIFLRELGNHFLLLMSGVVSVFISFVEKEDRRTLTKWGLRFFAALSFGAAAYLAWLDQWKAVRSIEAPRLSIVGSGELVVIPQNQRVAGLEPDHPDNPVALMKTEFKNAGGRPVKALSLMVSFGGSDSVSITFPAIADEILPGESLHTTVRLYKLPRTNRPTLASIVASYEDPFKPGGDGITQCFYRRWPPMPEGQLRASTEPADTQEASQIWHSNPGTRIGCADPEALNPTPYVLITGTPSPSPSQPLPSR